MYILTASEGPQDGAYAISNQYGENVLFIFEEEDDDKRGFAIFDTETYKLTYIDNPYKMFKVINYRDDALYDLQDYENCIVKLIIKEKRDKVNVDGTDILFLPWITPEGEQDALNAIKETPARVVMGHLELS